MEQILYLIITTCGIGILGIVFSITNTYIKNSQLNVIIGAIETAVLSVTQTYVDALKKEGKFDEEAAQIAKEKAIEIAKELISEDGMKLITKLYGNFAIYLDNKIEQFVNSNK